MDSDAIKIILGILIMLWFVMMNGAWFAFKADKIDEPMFRRMILRGTALLLGIVVLIILPRMYS